MHKQQIEEVLKNDSYIYVLQRSYAKKPRYDGLIKKLKLVEKPKYEESPNYECNRFIFNVLDYSEKDLFGEPMIKEITLHEFNYNRLWALKKENVQRRKRYYCNVNEHRTYNIWLYSEMEHAEALKKIEKHFSKENTNTIYVKNVLELSAAHDYFKELEKTKKIEVIYTFGRYSSTSYDFISKLVLNSIYGTKTEEFKK